ncbi:MAG: AraC family transcriptional regulator [Alcanivoracaceae bacterium]|nr:AraC family transcriptional regulator [Alcanivoracaceae bacterium]
MKNAILNHFYVVGTASSIVIALLLAVVIFRVSHGAMRNRRVLAVILLVLSLSVILNSLLNGLLAKYYSPVGHISEPFQLLFGPLLFLYLNQLNKGEMPVKIKLLHMLPFIFYTVYFVYFLSKGQQSLYISKPFTVIIMVLSFTAYMQLWLYYFLCKKELNLYRQQLKQSCSSLERINETWVTHSMFALLLCYLAITVLFLLNHGMVYLPVNKFLAIIISLIIYVIVYRILRQPEIITSLTSTDVMPLTQKIPKYKKSSLAQHDIEDNLIRLKKYMVLHKPYINPELNLNMLADNLNISPHHLSQVINAGNNTNFYDFINSYRLEEFKKQVAEPSNQKATVLSIAFKVGFNSKATFNRLFKKSTQQTPSEYKRRLSHTTD